MTEFHSQSARQLIKADMERYLGVGEHRWWELLGALYHDPGACSLFFYRLSQAVNSLQSSFCRSILKLCYSWTVYRLAALVLGVHIHSKASIGGGFCILYPGCIYIGPVKIGQYCSICQEVTIGYGHAGSDWFGVPTIGDQVYIAPGAKIFGKIRIGNGVSIGANSVVSKDLPDGAIAVGNPARIIGYQSKNPYIHNAKIMPVDIG